MNIQEFIAKGLKPRQEVVLTITNPGEKPRQVECYFAGYRALMGKKFFRNPNEGLVPVFYAKNKKGGMSNRYIEDQPTRLKHIADIYPKGGYGKKEHLSGAALRSLCNTALMTEKTCMENAIGLIRDMAALFPGKKIFFDNDAAPWAVKYEKYGADNGYVRAVWRTEKKMMFDFSGSVDGITTDDLHIDSWAHFLRCLIENIETPFIDEDSSDHDESFAHGLSWDEVPNPNPGECPFLAASGLLTDLMLGLWFDQEGKEYLSEDEWLQMGRAEKLSTYLRFVK